MVANQAGVKLVWAQAGLILFRSDSYDVFSEQSFFVFDNCALGWGPSRQTMENSTDRIWRIDLFLHCSLLEMSDFNIFVQYGYIVLKLFMFFLQLDIMVGFF
jgi:hypothetical protein